LFGWLVGCLFVYLQDKLQKAEAATKKQMEKAARDMDFIEAARLRDEMFRLQKERENMIG
jgi:excinuclease ABC subunit B